MTPQISGWCIYSDREAEEEIGKDPASSLAEEEADIG